MRYLVTGFMMMGTACLAQASAAEETLQNMPYVYTTWDHVTVKDGLPNDHIFAVKTQESRVWV